MQIMLALQILQCCCALDICGFTFRSYMLRFFCILFHSHFSARQRNHARLWPALSINVQTTQMYECTKIWWSKWSFKTFNTLFCFSSIQHKSKACHKHHFWMFALSFLCWHFHHKGFHCLSKKYNHKGLDEDHLPFVCFH